MVRNGIQMFSFVWFLVDKKRGKFYIDPLKPRGGKMGILSICTYCVVSDPHWLLVSMRPDPVIDDQKFIKIYSWKEIKVCWSKVAIYIYLSFHKGRLSYRRSLSPRKRTSSTSKHEIFPFFFWGSFLPSWIRIRNTDVQYLDIPLRQHKLEQVNLLFFYGFGTIPFKTQYFTD